ncbi:arylacetamide deacetylase-like 3 [Pogona vitticeps]
MGEFSWSELDSQGKIARILHLHQEPVIINFFLRLRKPKAHPSISSKDLCFDGVPVRLYQPKAPSAGRRKGFVFYHGGCGLFGSIGTYQNICSRIAKNSDSVVVCVGYRLAPKHPYPTQQKDCYTATVHFMQHAENYGVDPSQIIIGGDSAGGNYAAAIAQKLVGRSDLPKLRAQVLIYAGLQGMDFNLPSYQQNATFPLLYRHNVVYYGLHYLGKDISLRDDVLKGSHVPEALRLKYGKWVDPDNIPERFKRRGYERVPLAPFKPEVYKELSDILEVSFSPLFAEDSVIQQLPETLIVSCEYDVFRDDSLLYKKRLEDNGVKVSWFHVKNGFHAVMNLTNVGIYTFAAGVEILKQIADFVKCL